MPRRAVTGSNAAVWTTRESRRQALLSGPSARVCSVSRAPEPAGSAGPSSCHGPVAASRPISGPRACGRTVSGCRAGTAGGASHAQVEGAHAQVEGGTYPGQGPVAGSRPVSRPISGCRAGTGDGTSHGRSPMDGLDLSHGAQVDPPRGGGREGGREGGLGREGGSIIQ